MLSLIKHPEKNELSLQEQFKQNEMKIHMAENQFKYLRKLRLVTPRTSPILKELLDKRNTLKGQLEAQSLSLQRSASCPPPVENTNLNPQANESGSKRPISALSILLESSKNAAANSPKTQKDLVANETNALNDIERLGKSLSTHATSLAETAPPVSFFSPHDRVSRVTNTFFGELSYLEQIINERARKESNVPWHTMKVVQEREKPSSFSESEGNGSEDNDRDSCSSCLTNAS